MMKLSRTTRFLTLLAALAWSPFALTTAGVGDPPGMTLDDCSTLRNLNEEGRARTRRGGGAAAVQPFGPTFLHAGMSAVAQGPQFVSAGSVMAQIANSSQQPDVGNEVTRTTTSVGYSHRFSKRTDAYAVLMHDQFTGQSSGSTLGVGMRHRF
ncbi:MAG: porin [Rhodoferax sp.]